MTKIIIDYQDGSKVEYSVPNHVADAIDSLVMMYPHTVLELDKEPEDAKKENNSDTNEATN